jgi:hypothetical protein
MLSHAILSPWIWCCLSLCIRCQTICSNLAKITPLWKQWCCKGNCCLCFRDQDTKTKHEQYAGQQEIQWDTSLNAESFSSCGYCITYTLSRSHKTTSTRQAACGCKSEMKMWSGKRRNAFLVHSLNKKNVVHHMQIYLCITCRVYVTVQVDPHCLSIPVIFSFSNQIPFGTYHYVHVG